tara:strand:+ start:398 stop:1000 length:603 start_codon:yes stop_codon:yes gene_type:complete
MKENKLAIFDFDGTISSKDSTKFFLRLSFGNLHFFYGYYIRFIYLYTLSKLGVYNHKKLKEKRIKFFLNNMPLEVFEKNIDKFNDIFFNQYLKTAALKRLEWHKKNEHKIIILSATLSDLLKEWSFTNNYTLIANILSVNNNRLVGTFDMPDCSYEEKVVRLKENINLDNFDYIYGYGDSQSDKHFLNLVDKAYFQYFKL